jgi:hypothetical protein
MYTYIGPSIPESVSANKMVVDGTERVTEKQLMLNNGWVYAYMYIYVCVYIY